MNKEVISEKQGIYLIITLLVGSSSIMVMGIDAKQDAWIATLLAMIMSFPIVLIYARLQFIFLGKDLFDILQICFGKFIGKGICLLYVWFISHNMALILENTSRFIKTVSLHETLLSIPMIVIIILCIYITKAGIEVMGRWIKLFLPVIIVFICILILLIIPEMQINNIQPILYKGIKPVIKGAFSTFAFPFAETVVFTMFFSTFKRKISPYKVYITGLLIGGIVMFTISLANLLVLGANTASVTYYPSYATIARLNIGRFLRRLEVIVASVFLLGAFIKTSIFLLAACKGVCKIFSFTDYRFIVTPIALLIMNLSYLQNNNIMEIFEWVTEIWPYYAFSFQVILPVIIWFIAETKKKQLSL
ncbi:GerAB/ArcD/ProY family transporter [Wukongibacter sp. M2B1]|uniref:GerAB/ArcD/ProY family transporter n=1 Tax=Wukongibacter sp. M2B1 TaxID=3088895 RepID=UPI003D79B1FC